MTSTRQHQVRVAVQDGDGTAHLQAAIDSVSPDEGLHVILEPGIHRLGGIRLRSNLTLEIPEGAEMHFVSDYDAYASTTVSVIAEESDRGMLVAGGAHDLAIVGGGRIFGNGAAGFSSGLDEAMGTLIAHELRPRVLVLESCSDVRVEGVRIDDAPLWTMHLVACERVAVVGVAVDNNRRMPNTDGVAVDGCADVRIERSSFRTADDGVVLKTTRRADGSLTGECVRVTVRDCVVESSSCALKIGTESFSAFRDIVFEDIAIEGSNRGLGIFSRDGGVVDGVRFSRVRLVCRERPAGFWGSGEGLTINVLDRRPEEGPAGVVSGVVVEDVTGSMEGAVNIVAERAGGVRDLVMRRVRLGQRAGGFGTGLTYDLRPTVADRFDRFAEDGAEGRANSYRLDAEGRIIGLVGYPGGMPALFAKGVEGLVVEDVEIERPSPLPEGWNAEAIVRLD